MRTAAILPVKRLELSKQRLRASIAGELRAQVVRAMVGDVLSALGGCEAIERTIVVTNEPWVVSGASHERALVVPDAVEDGQSAAVSLGVAHALQQGYERVLCVPGDCPTLEPRELHELLGAGRATSANAPSATAPLAVIVPDRHGTGTNALLLNPPDAISPSFGPDSCARHRALAEAAGVGCLLRHPPSLLLDIDTGEDLRVLRARLASSAPRAALTRAALGASRARATPAVTV